MNWLGFWQALLPTMLNFARELFERHKGDVDRARAELLEIRNHGKRLELGEAIIDERISKLPEDTQAETPSRKSRRPRK